MHAQLAAQLRQFISSGEWQPGYRLPSEAELGAEAEVSRNTIRLALQALENEGLILRQAGKGSFVAPRKDRAALDKLIALVLHISRDPLPFSIYSGAQEAAREAGCDVMLADGGNSVAEEDSLLLRLEAGGYHNFIVWPSGEAVRASAMTEMVARGRNIVQVDRYIPQTRASYVGPDNTMGGYLATRSLIDLGHKNISFLTGQYVGISSVTERYEGYQEAMREAGLLPLLPLELPVDTGRSISRYGLQAAAAEGPNLRYLSEVLRRRVRPTAIFALHDVIAYQVELAAAQVGLRVPEDIAVIGFNDSDFCEDVPVPLSSIAQDGAAVGRTACELLLRRTREGISEPCEIRVPVRLVERASTIGG
jgi:DNA-binding LacI/PurR family transcriptional regulator